MMITMIAALAMAAGAPEARRAATPAGSAQARAARARRARAADLRAAAMMQRASGRFELADCGATGCAPHRAARYRLAGSTDLAPRMKDEAMAETGQKCAIIGQTLCQHKRRTVLHAEM